MPWSTKISLQIPTKFGSVTGGGEVISRATSVLLGPLRTQHLGQRGQGRVQRGGDRYHLVTGADGRQSAYSSLGGQAGS